MELNGELDAWRHSTQV